MKPFVSILMVTSIDGGLHPSRFTASPDYTRSDLSAEYEKVHSAMKGDAWLVGRVTMAEMSKAVAHEPASPWNVQRPIHIARKDVSRFAVAVDPSGKLHFQAGGTVAGDHVIVLLGRDVPDGHLAELASDGVSYVVSANPELDIPRMLDVLAREFGIKHLVVEGGAATNGSFLAAHVVDELQILIAPALDGAAQVQGIVAHGKGLAGLVRLHLKSADVLDHGVVKLTYSVLGPEA